MKVSMDGLKTRIKLSVQEVRDIRKAKRIMFTLAKLIPDAGLAHEAMNKATSGFDFLEDGDKGAELSFEESEEISLTSFAEQRRQQHLSGNFPKMHAKRLNSDDLKNISVSTTLPLKSSTDEPQPVSGRAEDYPQERPQPVPDDE